MADKAVREESSILSFLEVKQYLCSTNLAELEKIKVGIVNYLNTRPMLYGLTQGDIVGRIELIGDYPALVASKLKEGSIDVGLIPVAATKGLSEFHIVGNYGIATNGEVASVCLFSNVPLEQIKKIKLDYQSRTSAALLQLLVRDYWKLNVEFAQTSSEDFIDEIKDDTAALIIGDRALIQRDKSKFVYDLGLAWKEYTGLPFVFAAWISTKPLPLDFIAQFDAANAKGLSHISEIVAEIDFPQYDLKKYYTENVSYHLDAEKRKGMDLFLSSIS